MPKPIDDEVPADKDPRYWKAATNRRRVISLDELIQQRDKLQEEVARMDGVIELAQKDYISEWRTDGATKFDRAIELLASYRIHTRTAIVNAEDQM